MCDLDRRRLRDLILLMPLFHGVEDKGEWCVSIDLIRGRELVYETSTEVLLRVMGSR